MASEQFSLCWDNFHKNMSSGMNSLLESEDLVDVTLAVEGKYLKAHKMVLSVCSPYFRELFKVNPCKHPIVFLKDVSYVAMSDLLQFMYQGEVQVSQENLTTFIKTAEALQIKGLTGDGNGTSEGDADLLEDHQQPFKADTTTPKPALTPSSTRQKRTQHSQIITPSNVKKPRVSSPPITSKQTLLTSKSEVATPASSSVSGSITPATELIQFKMEPSENVHGHSTITSEDVEQDFDDTLDDTGDETNEEYAMMEGGDEEPQAGTSAEGTAAAGEGQGLVYFDMGTKKPKMILENCEFLTLRTKDDETTWRCRKYFHPKENTERCKVRLVTTKGTAFIFGEHNHLPTIKTPKTPAKRFHVYKVEHY